MGSISGRYGVGKKLEMRRDRLNAIIAKKGCPFKLPKIRGYQDGAYEIVDFHSSYENSKPFFWLFTFICRKPYTGEPGFYTIEFSSQIVYVPMLDGRVLLSHYFLPTLGYWNYWIPTALTSLPDPVTSDKRAMWHKNRPEMVLRQKIAGIPEIETGPAFNIEIQYLGSSAKDKGQSMVVNPYYFVRIEDAEFVAKPKRGRYVHWWLFTLDELDELALGEKKPWDNKSQTAHNLLMVNLRRGKIDLGRQMPRN